MTLATMKISLLPSLSFGHRQDLPPIPALYFVLNDQREIAYIGETENLRARWKSHHRARQMSTGGYRIHWRQISDTAERADAEQKSIKYFRPLWNRTEVPITERKRVGDYIENVARHMGIDPDELVCKILMDWAYNRTF